MPRRVPVRCWEAGRRCSAPLSSSWRSSSPGSRCSTVRPPGSRRICEMDTTDVGDRQMATEAENERLRARVAALESELLEVQARANAAVAEWQERAYWLDRLHIDLNAVMARPGAKEVRGVLKAVRAVFWRLKRIKRRMLGT